MTFDRGAERHESNRPNELNMELCEELVFANFGLSNVGEEGGRRTTVLRVGSPWTTGELARMKELTVIAE